MPCLIRPATSGDYDTYATLFPELEIDDPVPPCDEWDRARRATTLIAEDAGEALGYSSYRVLDGVGYVSNLVVAPAARCRGVGRALMDAMADVFRAGGASLWCLNVKPGNAPAIRLYENCGLRAQYPSVVLRIRWALVDGLPADEPGVVAREVTATEAGAVEAALDLLPGKVSRRALVTEGRVPIQLRGVQDEILAYADFAPSFPGAFPFRVTRPGLCGHLLRALRPHALDHHDHIQLVVDDDDATVALLCAAGAETREQIVHYRSPLPPASTPA